MTFDLTIRISKDRYRIESKKINYYRDDPAMTMSVDINGKEFFLYIGESMDNIVNQKEYGEFLELYGHQNPKFYNPFSGATFSSEAASQVIFYYVNSVMQQQRARIPAYFRDVVISLLDKADVFVDIQDREAVTREQYEELLRKLSDQRFLKSIKLQTIMHGIISC